MEFVQPIRDKKKIENIWKKWLISQNHGINCGLRISDILKMIVEDVLTEKGKPQKRSKYLPSVSQRIEKCDLLLSTEGILF